MARTMHHATDAVGDGAYPSLVNQGYVSEYYLAYRLTSGFKELYDAWRARERDGGTTPRTALRGLRASLAKHRVDAMATAPDEEASEGNGRSSTSEPDARATEAQHALNAAILDALGWTPAPEVVTLLSAATAYEVPTTHVRRTASGPLLMAIETVFSTDPSAGMGSKRALAGTLLEPIRSNDRVVAETMLEAAQVVFTADDPPQYLLFTSGGSVVLLDRARWGEGTYLGVALEEALERDDQRPHGELAAVAALFCAESIDPDSGAESALTTMLERSTSESAGVSKELRTGVRRSVEILAAAVVDDVRNRQKKRWQDIDATELTRQSLRYLYRIIVLLYAEARPELGILPVDDPDYRAGYSMERLREVALVDLHGDRARHATHLQDSLDVLFRLVNDGYLPEASLDGARSLEFPGLTSTLFGEDACAMIDRARIPDAVMQQILANLSFTQEGSGRERKTVSYATLGINQLGAVYEGLMAYRGFLATEELFELDDDGDPDNGTWVVPVDRADAYPDEVFVKERGVDGIERRVRYREGDFVFRLAGRDRQRSASYYTPEVLTEFTVRHALEVLEEERPDLTARDWLRMPVLEPALGSGAFANEAVNQLAERYLKAAQRERGETIDAERYPYELQKAKAHFAINQTYGVDLNATGVELAEVSMWLNIMHEGLEAPRFDARLKRGNSLIGARRSTYTATQVNTAPWKGTSKNPVVPPTDVPIHEHPLGSDVGIHHFLVPGEGWGAAAGAKDLKGTKSTPGLAQEWAEAVNAWRKRVLAKPAPGHVQRLDAVARRVEQAWAEAARDVQAHFAAHQRRIDVWGAEPDALPHREHGARASRVHDPDGAYARLHLVMDAWTALWMWAPHHGTDLPTLEMWIDALEMLFGQTAEDSGSLFSLSDTTTSDRERVAYFGKARVEEVLAKHPWLRTCQDVAAEQGFFHWELTFAPIFELGGFDLQVGNPPWVRPTWDEPASLSEFDPWWATTNLTQTSNGEKENRKTTLLEDPRARGRVAADLAENEGLNALLAAGTREPVLRGVQTNLYMNFMTAAWRRNPSGGAIGFVHPESHFVDPKGGQLREETYARLRRHFQYSNGLKLFEDPGSVVEFGVSVYSGRQSPRFVNIVSLLTPQTADRSIDHDGSGDVPGIQYPEGGWDLRPHAQRVVTIDDEVLANWVKLFDEPGTPPRRSRLLRPLTNADLEALAVFAKQPRRLGDVERYWTSGFHEKGAKDDGTFEWRTEFPSNLGDAILQGPHVLNATPFAQQPRENCKSNGDWDALDLETLPPDFIPRTNYQRSVDPEEFKRRQTTWNGAPYTTRYREAHREFVNPGLVRTLQACLLPVDVVHLHAVNSVFTENTERTTILTGMLSSLPYDYFVKVSGVGHVTKSVVDAFPIPGTNPRLERYLLLRTLRLNGLTSGFAPLWAELFDPGWSDDAFASGVGTVPLARNNPQWDAATPLRTDLDRWLALVDIDAIVAHMLGLSERQLLQMYRSQFPVLRKYEYVTVFDGNGRQISGIHHNYGFHQRRWENDLKAAPTQRGEKKIGMWDRVQAYMAGDETVDLGPFVPPFTPADRETAMTKAYRAFEARLSDA